jgi:N-acetyl sugar amidotransferase
MTIGDYRMCSRCVMDTSAAGITFDEAGICSYCKAFVRQSSHILDKAPEDRRRDLEALVAEIKKVGRDKRYDCVMGVSGGVDSSWALVKAVELGLRPLAVHMDNGWNSELAQNNIANLVRGLGIDLYTHVIDWGEYRQLMQAFFDADVIDVELLYDNAMLAVNYQQAKLHGVRHILAGTNQSTEGMPMPANWNWFKFDKKNIRAIARQRGNVKLRTFPAIGTLDFIRYEFVSKARWISFLDYFDYNKAASMAELQDRFGYKPYPYKHYESVFTRFYQGYILPRKFGVDKRRLHLSSLIVTGQMPREIALQDLERIPYPSERDLEEDRRYFLKKLGWSEGQLEDYLSRPEVSHAVYGTEKPLWDACINIYRRYFRRR